MGSFPFPSCPAHFLLFSPQPPYDNERVASDQPRPQGFSLKKWEGKSPGDEVGLGQEYIFARMKKQHQTNTANNNSNKQNNNKLEI